MSEKREEEVHVVMLPWLAFGHMIPFLDLSIELAKSNIHVSFLSTPRNIQRLPQIPPNLIPFIDFVPLPLEYSGGLLPEYAEATIDITVDRMNDLKIASDLLRQPIKDFMAEKLPDWIVVDFFPYWIVDIARDLSIPIISHCVFAAAAAAFFWSPEFLSGEGRRSARPSPEDFTAPPDWFDFLSEVALSKHEAKAMHHVLYDVNSSGIADGDRLTRLLQASAAVSIRTCTDFEPDYLGLYSKLTGKPVIPIGLLPPETPPDRPPPRQEAAIFNWLDRQKPRSAVFVGFGSETKLNREHIHEIAHGLELSGVPFLWAMRKPDNEALPAGFLQRTAEQGVVHLGWAPQREILGHPSIGGSLFHGGWGSIIETLQYGHALVLLPFVFDQPLNTKLMVEKGLGVEVERDGEDGSFTRNDVASALKKGMVSDVELRARCRKAGREIFGNQDLHRAYVEKFVRFLKGESCVFN
ncbi:hypothetical protein ABFS82_04G148400 [Erythranthe guttata]|uniref:Glycosyltransferase n=1 Tax=Erythranthe guttata TaxID=4155 RepID=A0A022Q7G8_ERYGU|nr:hypothetical protein MIMGU_mgv1a026446mg [Erythranthe guttata]